VSKIEKIVIADKDQLAESWFKPEILGALDKVTIDWVDPSANDGDRRRLPNLDPSQIILQKYSFRIESLKCLIEGSIRVEFAWNRGTL
jgi:hypothetical protein